MSNIIINYKKEWSNDGTVYNQTIKVNKKIMKDFNKYIKIKKEAVQNKHILSNEDMKILYYLEYIEEGKNYTTLTTLDYFIKFYWHNIYIPPKKDRTFERMLWRNTIIQVI